ncbi:hypothetical protein [Actinomadura sp. 3N508]|uniref:hypothetical protein n=1 Tax=Actinomadura sp. 3N508 TaxID=3375153 RepID=UPI00378CEEDC
MDHDLRAAAGELPQGVRAADGWTLTSCVPALDHVARTWTRGSRGIDRDEMLDVLTENWFGTIGRH